MAVYHGGHWPESTASKKGDLPREPRISYGFVVPSGRGGCSLSEVDAPAGWFVIEDTDKPSHEFEEPHASSDIARELLEKKVGDSAR